MLVNTNDGICTNISVPQRYRYKSTPFKNYFKKIDPIITSDQWIITVPRPIRVFLTELDIYDNNANNDNPRICHILKPNINIIQEHFLKEGRLEIKTAIRILHDAGELFEKESTLLELNRPITFVGDISGQYYDLLTLLKLGGCVKRFKYLFLGHYVNGGYFGIECIIHLCAMKLNYPDNIYLLRSNHETRLMSQLQLFKRECEVKYNDEFYKECMLLFDKLPLAALIDNRFLCLHGGITPNITKLDDIRRLNRFCEPKVYSTIFDILWSDPIPNYDNNKTINNFEHNERRGFSYYYTLNGVENFLIKNNLNSIIRGHEIKFDGFKCYLNSSNSSMPSVLSIFSSPNYHDIYGNKGAIIQYDNCNFTIRQYASVAHPYWLYNFECAITLTLPFLAEKVTNILLVLLKNCVEGGTEDMFMPKMKQICNGTICCQQSVEFEKILNMKKSIKKVCKISAYYSNIRKNKLKFLKLYDDDVRNNNLALQIIGKNQKSFNPDDEKLNKSIIDDTLQLNYKK